MKKLVLPAEHIHGVLKVPGDKSISHRALLLGAIASGRHVINGLSTSRDVGRTAQALKDLGCYIETMPDGRTMILSHNLGGDSQGDVRVDAGNSGTTARLLAGLAAGLKATVTIDGDQSLRGRPMERVAEPLALMGAAITLAEGGTLPMTVGSNPLRGIRYELPVASAQVKSAILFAGLFATGDTTVVEPVPTRDHTERMLQAMGARCTAAGGEITVPGGQRIRGADLSVPGDVSSAAFFAAACACLSDSEVCLPVTGVNPTRLGFLNLLGEMGAVIRLENPHEMSGEPTADVVVQSPPGGLKAVVVDDPARVAAAIDELPLFAVVATQADGETVVRGAGELKHKESDRIAAITKGLAEMGADIEATDDGFAVRGPTRLRGADVSTFGDHRIAMALAVAGLVAKSETVLDDASVVDISYPGFFNDMRTLLP
jgi:3-phosphoshikimate 1-carboxyvinyltransferase